MQLPVTSLIGLGLILLGALIVFTQIDADDHRFNLVGYLLKYIGVILLVFRIFSIQKTVIILLVGIMTTVVLGTEEFRNGLPLRLPKLTVNHIMRVLISMILFVLTFTIEPMIARWIPIPDSILFAVLFLILLGLAEFSLTGSLLIRFLALISMLLGYMLVMVFLEDATLTFAILIGTMMTIALIGAYFISESQPAAVEIEVNEDLSE
jgi:hypothetical protein